MRASSWASTTTRRARSVNRSNMLIAPEVRGPDRLTGHRGTGSTTPRTAYAFPVGDNGGPLRANTGWQHEGLAELDGHAEVPTRRSGSSRPLSALQSVGGVER